VTGFKAFAAYLTGIRAVMNDASASRRLWVRQIGELMMDARARPPEMVAPVAGRIGAEQHAAFEEIRERLNALHPTQECETCQMTVQSWFDKQLAACDLMMEIGATGEINKLRGVQSLLSDGRIDTQRFSAEYAALVAMLRERVEARRKGRGGSKLGSIFRRSASTDTNAGRID
jgi:hypothetical protein